MALQLQPVLANDSQFAGTEIQPRVKHADEYYLNWNQRHLELFVHFLLCNYSTSLYRIHYVFDYKWRFQHYSYKYDNNSLYSYEQLQHGCALHLFSLSKYRLYIRGLHNAQTNNVLDFPWHNLQSFYRRVPDLHWREKTSAPFHLFLPQSYDQITF